MTAYKSTAKTFNRTSISWLNSADERLCTVLSWTAPPLRGSEWHWWTCDILTIEIIVDVLTWHWLP